MVYSDVINGGLILPKKALYTFHDVKRLISDSLTTPVNGRTLTERGAVFIVKASAVYHGTDYSEPVRRYGRRHGIYTGQTIQKPA